MTLAIAIILFLVVAAIYIIGSFMPLTTTMRLIDVEQNIDQCFAAANSIRHLKDATKHLREITRSNPALFEVGSTGKINFGGGDKGYEIITFTPNYRIAAEHRNGSERSTVQVSFYQLSRKSTRIVVITQFQSPSSVVRFKNALGAKKQATFIDEMLKEAKAYLEGLTDELEKVADVAPEENPNFSLR